MKTKLVLIAVACLLFFSVMGHASVIRSTRGDHERPLRDFWHDIAYNTQVMSDPEFRAIFGVSDEQHQKIRDVWLSAFQGGELGIRDTPEYREREALARAIYEQHRNTGLLLDHLLLRVDQETRDKYDALDDKVGLLRSIALSKAIDDILTSEQKQQIKEAQLANMAYMPIVSPSMFEALNLTDAQKQQMEKIKQEHEPEFEKHLNNFVNDRIASRRKLFEALDILFDTNKDTLGEQKMMQAAQAIRERSLDDPEHKKAREEHQSQGRAFAAKYKTLIFDVLTDEQWIRLQELIDNPPEHAKIYGEKLKERMNRTEEGLWRPSSAIPEGYRIERGTRGRFPRGE